MEQRYEVVCETTGTGSFGDKKSWTYQLIDRQTGHVVLAFEGSCEEYDQLGHDSWNGVTGVEIEPDGKKIRVSDCVSNHHGEWVVAIPEDIGDGRTPKERADELLKSVNSRYAELERWHQDFERAWRERDERRTAEITRLRDAAQKGDPEAQFNLACALEGGTERGYPVKRDEVEAAKWYAKAAEQHLASAQCSLGLMYAQGRGVPCDDNQAAMWFGKAAEQGLATAQFNLGSLFFRGRGVAKSYEKAANWYLKAAEQGDADAQCNLGSMYDHARGLPKDDAEAVKWWRLAAGQGHVMAQTWLRLKTKPWRCPKCASTDFDVEEFEFEDPPFVPETRECARCRHCGYHDWEAGAS